MKRTAPKQAASPRTVDRWQREIAALQGRAMLLAVDMRAVAQALTRLLRSIERTERR